MRFEEALPGNRPNSVQSGTCLTHIPGGGRQPVTGGSVAGTRRYFICNRANFAFYVPMIDTPYGGLLPALESFDDRRLHIRLIQEFLSLRTVLLLQCVLSPRYIVLHHLFGGGDVSAQPISLSRLRAPQII